MTHSAARTLFAGTAHLYEAGGTERSFSYKGSYSSPCRDQQGCIRFGWTATVLGVERQPQPRTTIVQEPGRVPEAGLVERTIQRAIEEHLAVFAGEPRVKIG